MRSLAVAALASLVVQVGFVIPEEIAVAYFVRTRTSHSTFIRDYCDAYDLLHVGHRAAFTRLQFATWAAISTPFLYRPTLLQIMAMPAVYDESRQFAKVQLVGTVRGLGGVSSFTEFATLHRDPEGWRIVLSPSRVQEVAATDPSAIRFGRPSCPQDAPTRPPMPAPLPTPGEERPAGQK
jgi:hypothetical protein